MKTLDYLRVIFAGALFLIPSASITYSLVKQQDELEYRAQTESRRVITAEEYFGE